MKLTPDLPVFAKVVETANSESAADFLDFSCSPTKLVKLTNPILQFFSSCSSPGPGIRDSLDTRKIIEN
jgi:hypothetical protein